MVADEIIARAADRHALLEHAQLELAQPFIRPLVRMRDQRADVDASCDGGLNGLLNVIEVESDNDEVERLLCALNPGDERLNVVGRLNDEIYVILPPASSAVSRNGF